VSVITNRAETSRQPLRGLLLGAGNIGLQGHSPHWAWGLGGRVEIVGVADLSPSNREAARALFPRARLYGNAGDALAGESPDFVDICTPPFTHRALIETAAGKGMHIVCETPLASSFEDALHCATVVKDAGVVFQPCHQYKYSTSWRAIRDRAQRLGAIYLAECSVRRTAAKEGSQYWTPEWRTRLELAGGGILVDQGVHVLYQLRSVMGDPRTVSATVRSVFHHDYEVEDTALLTLDYGAALAQVNLTWAAKRREAAFRFVGEWGELVGDEETVGTAAARTESIPVAGQRQNPSDARWFGPMLVDFVDRVQRHDLDHGPLDEAVYVAWMIECAYRSSTTGRPVMLDRGEPVRQTKPLS
jgi:predicted dehydrogenase